MHQRHFTGQGRSVAEPNAMWFTCRNNWELPIAGELLSISIALAIGYLLSLVSKTGSPACPTNPGFDQVLPHNPRIKVEIRIEFPIPEWGTRG
jgi:hypothetical protein